MIISLIQLHLFCYKISIPLYKLPVFSTAYKNRFAIVQRNTTIIVALHVSHIDEKRLMTSIK